MPMAGCSNNCGWSNPCTQLSGCSSLCPTGVANIPCSSWFLSFPCVIGHLQRHENVTVISIPTSSYAIVHVRLFRTRKHELDVL